MAKKNDVRIIFFRLGRLQTLLLNNHIVREVGPFPMSYHIYIYTDTNPITLPCSLARAGINVQFTVIVTNAASRQSSF